MGLVELRALGFGLVGQAQHVSARVVAQQAGFDVNAEFGAFT